MWKAAARSGLGGEKAEVVHLRYKWEFQGCQEGCSVPPIKLAHFQPQGLYTGCSLNGGQGAVGKWPPPISSHMGPFLAFWLWFKCHLLCILPQPPVLPTKATVVNFLSPQTVGSWRAGSTSCSLLCLHPAQSPMYGAR